MFGYIKDLLQKANSYFKRKSYEWYGDPCTVAAYYPKRGPMAYGACIIRGRVVTQVTTELAASSLTWCWESDLLRDPTIPCLVEFVTDDLLMRLTPDKLPAFIPCVQVSPIPILLLGIEPDTLDTVQTPAGLRAAKEAFAVNAGGPIRVVVFAEQDGRSEIVYVPSEPSPPIASLLDSWGIRPEAIRQTIHNCDNTTGVRIVFRLQEVD
jgi:hypothetical protein